MASKDEIYNKEYKRLRRLTKDLALRQVSVRFKCKIYYFNILYVPYEYFNYGLFLTIYVSFQSEYGLSEEQVAGTYFIMFILVNPQSTLTTIY